MFRKDLLGQAYKHTQNPTLLTDYNEYSNIREEEEEGMPSIQSTVVINIYIKASPVSCEDTDDLGFENILEPFQLSTNGYQS